MTIKYTFNQIQLEAFNIELDSYTDKFTEKAKFKCTKCTHMWWSTVARVTANGICPACFKYKTYLIYFPELDLYKIGLAKSVRRRIKEFGFDAELILEIEHDSRDEAVANEYLWLEGVQHLKVNTKLLISGNTETFKINQ